MRALSADSASDDRWSTMMKAAMAGDEPVYRRLLEEVGRSVRAMARAAFARARLGDADVEDAVQETLLAIHLKRHTWDPSLAWTLGERRRSPQDHRRHAPTRRPPRRTDRGL